MSQLSVNRSVPAKIAFEKMCGYTMKFRHPLRKDTSKKLEFAQMQGAEKICEHPLRGLPAYPTSQRRI